MFETHRFARKPFYVEAVQITSENMADVAHWCKGNILAKRNEQYIKVDVNMPMTERQTMAFVGDWVLFAGNGFKVYPEKAFRSSFEQAGPETILHEGVEADDAQLAIVEVKVEQKPVATTGAVAFSSPTPSAMPASKSVHNTDADLS